MLCAPLAIAALVLYPVVWIVLLPFRILGVAVDGVLGLIRAVLWLPARALGFRRASRSRVMLGWVGEGARRRGTPSDVSLHIVMQRPTFGATGPK